MMTIEEFQNRACAIRPKLFRIALQMLKQEEDAEDLVQETLLNLWINCQKENHYLHWDAVAITILKNKAIDKLRKKKQVFEEIDNQIIKTNETNALTHLTQKDALQTIVHYINQLPELQRLIMTMKEIEDYEIEQIAQITQSSVESVRTNLSRARKKIREKFLEK
ncbi:MAG: sigma-70 family RNA polymerase sigma factor [Bacteroidales bacterium]|jgi:RNA polymerase sigma-70 factor (ECF subfamily)|nr:sigma-70 family RNA polymerase sigma factor [Bacteroidales bacterium]